MNNIASNFKYPLDAHIKYESYSGGARAIMEGKILKYSHTLMNVYDDECHVYEYIVYNKTTKQNEPVPEERIKEWLR